MIAQVLSIIHDPEEEGEKSFILTLRTDKTKIKHVSTYLILSIVSVDFLLLFVLKTDSVKFLEMEEISKFSLYLSPLFYVE